jgi:hypothetical protein
VQAEVFGQPCFSIACAWAEEAQPVSRRTLRFAEEMAWRTNLAPSSCPRGPLLHPIYKNINRAIIYASGSSHTYIQQIIKISQHMSRIKAYKL